MILADFLPTMPVHILIARAALVYGVLYVALRLAGKRQASQMGAAELMGLLMLSDAVQNSMVGNDTSVSGGLICALTLLGMSVAIEYISFRWPRTEKALEGTPSIIIYRGEIRRDAMNKEWLSRHDLSDLLRRQGIARAGAVDLAVLEVDGSLSVIKKSTLEKDDDDTSGDDKNKSPATS